MNDPMKTVETVYKSEDMRIVRVGARIVLMSRFGWALSYTKKDWDQCLKEMEKADSELSIIWKVHDLPYDLQDSEADAKNTCNVAADHAAFYDMLNGDEE